MIDDDYDDGYRKPEDLLEDGWLEGDTADEIRRLLRLVEFGPVPGSKSNAALVMIDYHLRTKDVDENDPTLVWARQLLKDTT